MLVELRHVRIKVLFLLSHPVVDQEALQSLQLEARLVAALPSDQSATERDIVLPHHMGPVTRR